MGKGVPRLKTGEVVISPAFVSGGGGGWPTHDGNASLANANDPAGTGGAMPYWQPKPNGSYPHTMRPTFITAHGLNTEWPNASSTHAGKMNVTVMADGSVKLIPPTMIYIVYQRLNGFADAKVTENNF